MSAAAPNPASVVFLSWYRKGLAARVQAPTNSDPLAVTMPPESIIPVKVTLGEPSSTTKTASATVRVHGPGDVAALDARQIVRTWPPADAQAVASDTFPMIEFADAGLPWLLTPTGPARETDPTSGRRRGTVPWLCLVVVPSATAGLSHAPGQLAQLTVSTAELPDLAHSHLLGPRPGHTVRRWPHRAGTTR